MRRCWLPRHVRPGWEQEKVIQAVNYVLWANVLLSFDQTGWGHRSVHADVRDFLEVVLVVSVLQAESTTKRHDQVLKEVNWRFSRKPKVAGLEQLTLFLRAVVQQLHLLDFRVFSKVLKCVLLLCILEKFRNMLLEDAGFGRADVAAFRQVVADGVRHPHVRKKLEVHKFEQRLVELEESAHDLVVDIEGQTLRKFVRLNPRDRNAHNLHSVVDAFDRKERFCKALRHRAVVHKVRVQLLASLEVLFGDFECHVLGQLCIQRDETQSIVEVPERIHEGGVPILDHWHQRVLRQLLHVVFSGLYLSAAQEFLVLLEVGLDFSELLEQMVVLQNLQVLHVEISLVVALDFLLWLARVHALQDAEAAEVLQRDLHVADGVGPSFELRGISFGAGFDAFAHFYLIILILAAPSEFWRTSRLPATATFQIPCDFGWVSGAGRSDSRISSVGRALA